MMGILVAGIALLLVAAALLKRALIPGRIGTTPYCRRCKYNLSGLTPDASAQCPECGLPLSLRNVVRGERPRRRRVLCAGLLLAAVGIMFLVGAVFRPFRSVNWYAHKPNWWLLSDLESGDPGVRDHAWAEFTTRDAGHRLSDGDRARFDTLLVHRYAAGSGKLPPAAGDYLVDRFGHLTAEAKSAVFQRLLMDLLSNTAAVAADAQKRLERLERSNDLSAEHHARLTVTALATQAANKPHPSLDYLLYYLDRRELAGQLTPGQRDQFFLACAEPVLDVRPTVLAGDDIPVYVHYAGRGAWVFGSCGLRMTGGQLDALPAIPLRRNDGGTSLLAGTTAAGTHTVRITFEVTVDVRNRPPGSDKIPLRWSRPVTLARAVTIVPPGTDDLTWIDDPSLADAIRAAVGPGEHGHAQATSSHPLFFVVGARNAPVNVAFDVYARDASGREYPAGPFTARAGETFFTGREAPGFPPGPNVGHVDLIFRSSERAMRSTPDLYEAWRGEIVFTNVPVTREGPAPSTPPR